MKTFIKQVEKEVSSLIERHALEINSLKKKLMFVEKENEDLQKQLKRSMRNYDHENIECLSPIKPKTSSALGTHKSNFFGESVTTNFFQTTPHKKVNATTTGFGTQRRFSKEFPIDIIDRESTPQDTGVSRF